MSILSFKHARKMLINSADVLSCLFQISTAELIEIKLYKPLIYGFKLDSRLLQNR